MMYVSAFVGSQTKMSFCEKEGPGPTPCPLSFSESQIRVGWPGLWRTGGQETPESGRA